MSQPLAHQLEQQLLQLAAKAALIDQKQAATDTRSCFESDLFQSQSPHLLDYVQEAQQLLQRLHQTSIASSQQWLAEKLARQVDALSRAFATVALRQQQARPRPKTNKAPTSEARQRAGALLRELGGSTQALYQKLAEYHEFERRLDDMARTSALQQEPPERQLAIHARLGRCRKAIAALEAEIQWAEQRQLQR